MAAKYGMAKNNWKDTNQLMRPTANRGRELRVDNVFLVITVGARQHTLNFLPLGLFAI
jgi:hypothetical protein